MHGNVEGYTTTVKQVKCLLHLLECCAVSLYRHLADLAAQATMQHHAYMKRLQDSTITSRLQGTTVACLPTGQVKIAEHCFVDMQHQCRTSVTWVCMHKLHRT